MRRWLPVVALLAVVTIALVVATRGSGSGGPASRAARIDAQVRCPACAGQSALDSNAPAARAVREFVAARVAAGDRDGVILAALRDRFGADILLKPPAGGVGGLVWQIPVVVLIVGGGALGLAFWRWRPRPAGPVSAEDRALVERALQEGRPEGAP